MWEGMPTSRSDLWRDPEHAARFLRVCAAMRADGMYSPKTIDADVEFSVFRHIQLARRR